MRAATRPDPDALAAALSTLRTRFGERLAEGEAICRQHGNQTSEVPNEPPDAVLFPETTEEVREAVRVCADHRIPIIPYGVGSSFEGHVNAPFGGLSVDTSRMKRIVAVNVDDLVRYVGKDVGPKYLGGTIDQPRYLVAIPMTRVQTWIGTGKGDRGEWHRRYYDKGTKWYREYASTKAPPGRKKCRRSRASAARK